MIIHNFFDIWILELCVHLSILSEPHDERVYQYLFVASFGDREMSDGDIVGNINIGDIGYWRYWRYWWQFQYLFVASFGGSSNVRRRYWWQTPPVVNLQSDGWFHNNFSHLIVSHFVSRRHQNKNVNNYPSHRHLSIVTPSATADRASSTPGLLGDALGTLGPSKLDFWGHNIFGASFSNGAKSKFRKQTSEEMGFQTWFCHSLLPFIYVAKHFPLIILSISQKH